MSTAPTVTGPSSHCFACGTENVNGLHLAFGRDPDGASRAEFVTRPDHIGWPDTIHGGILFTVLDEAAAWALHLEGLRGVTAKADVRFRAPVRVGVQMVVTAKIVGRNRRTVDTKAELREADGGKLCAEMDGTMFVVEG